MKQMRIKLYGRLSGIAGTESILLEPLSTVGELTEALIKNYPEMAGHLYIIAVNHKKAEPETIISPQDEIALLPPFSGG